MAYMYQTRVQFLLWYWFISLVGEQTFGYLAIKRVRPILASSKVKKKPQLRIVNSWPMSIILNWSGRKSLMLKNVNYAKAWTIFIHKFTAQLLYCTKKLNCDITLFLWFSVNCRTLPLEFLTTAHIRIISCFSTLKKSFIFFISNSKKYT